MMAAAIICSTHRGVLVAAGSAKSRPTCSPASSCLHRRLFDGVTDRVFSLVRLFDRAEHLGRLSGIVHDGEWYHIGTPAGLEATRERLSSHRIER